MKSLEERFWGKVDVGNKDECWDWKASTRTDGYGQLQRGRRGDGVLSAHRASWIIHYGEIPEHDSYHGMCVCHTCDNKLCVNPAHLFLGTNEDNMKDKVKKGIQMRGSKVPQSKLSEEDVIEIREIKQSIGLSQQCLAKMFGVSNGTISMIINNKRWTWLK